MTIRYRHIVNIANSPNRKASERLRQGGLSAPGIRQSRARADTTLFTPDHALTYLEGRHCIEAARKFLTGNERWWVADLYSDDLSLQVKNVLREHDPNCAKYYDGDILRQIRISTIQGDTARREKFLARLSKSKQDCVKRLELLPEEFWDSLDALIPFAGLWPAIFIGAFPRLLNLHCPEEMTRYLRRVKPMLIYIIGPLSRLILRRSCGPSKPNAFTRAPPCDPRRQHSITDTRASVLDKARYYYHTYISGRHEVPRALHKDTEEAPARQKQRLPLSVFSCPAQRPAECQSANNRVYF
ncbi:hypothetical protein V1522DRAFT_455243 [Lipomyces starkeyi]